MDEAVSESAVDSAVATLVVTYRTDPLTVFTEVVYTMFGVSDVVAASVVCVVALSTVVALASLAELSSAAVSYTHLDVYKRQTERTRGKKKRGFSLEWEGVFSNRKAV